MGAKEHPHRSCDQAVVTVAWWTDWWWYWLWAVLLTFLGPEIVSILIRRQRFGVKIFDWTLSDCVRRWSQAHHWVPAAVIISMAALCYHWFAMSNQ